MVIKKYVCQLNVINYNSGLLNINAWLYVYRGKLFLIWMFIERTTKVAYSARINVKIVNEFKLIKFLP